MRIPHRQLSIVAHQGFGRQFCSGASAVESHASSLLEKCASLSQLQQIHAFLITSGLGRTQFLVFKLIRLCTLALSNLSYARRIFDGLENANVYIWTAMITAYAQESHAPDCRVAFVLYTRMHRKDRLG